MTAAANIHHYWDCAPECSHQLTLSHFHWIRGIILVRLDLEMTLIMTSAKYLFIFPLLYSISKFDLLMLTLMKSKCV